MDIDEGNKSYSHYFMRTCLPLRDTAMKVDQELASISVLWKVDKVSQKANNKFTEKVSAATAFLLSCILTKPLLSDFHMRYVSQIQWALRQFVSNVCISRPECPTLFWTHWPAKNECPLWIIGTKYKEMSFRVKDGLRDIAPRGQTRNSRGYRVEHPKYYDTSVLRL